MGKSKYPQTNPDRKIVIIASPYPHIVFYINGFKSHASSIIKVKLVKTIIRMSSYYLTTNKTFLILIKTYNYF